MPALLIALAVSSLISSTSLNKCVNMACPSMFEVDCTSTCEVGGSSAFIGECGTPVTRPDRVSTMLQNVF